MTKGHRGSKQMNMQQLFATKFWFQKNYKIQYYSSQQILISGTSLWVGLVFQIGMLDSLISCITDQKLK